MRRYTLLSLVTLTLLMLIAACAPAFAQTYSFNEIYASIDLPDGVYSTVLTPDNLGNNTAFLTENGTDAETAADDFAAQGILLKAYDNENDRIFVLSALQTVDAQMYFDLNEQGEDMRREFRVSHKDGTAYGILGYTYSSSAWKNYGGNVLRFLNTQYTLRQAGEESCQGYQKRTIRNGYTITLDMQVYGRKANENDLKALDKIMSSFQFTQILPMPKLPAKLILSSSVPAEISEDTFTIRGITTPKAEVTVTAMSLASSDSVLFSDKANSEGDFSVQVTLPAQGVYTLTIAAEGAETLRTQFAHTVNFQRGLLAVTLTSQPGSVLSAQTEVSGSTLSGVETQLVVTGPNGYTYNKSTENKSFKFAVDTSLDGTYQFNLTFAKKGYTTRSFTFTGTRSMSAGERIATVREDASSPAYSKLKQNLSSYEGDIVTFTGYIAEISHSQSVNEWTVVLGLTKLDSGYNDLIYVICKEDPGVMPGQRVRLYGTVSGEFPIVNEDKSFPRCELIFFESAE
ncbi:MAG: hypothetical protein IKT57_09060 [Clostridia bacterium]|nr:hypothetical protein [Clostridia bacterium]